ncbi:MAG: hypothetical protein A2Z38_06835 [Planctomycetes bacterium RBG_19FT_COMBO_48_8]|nr:MAG: hypothetical protein A2Z38_06835 [Planctomycetes bacterium RBG_19FT_COMBO_48_8]
MRIIVFFVVVARHFFIKNFVLIRQKNRQIMIGNLSNTCNLQLLPYAETAIGQSKKPFLKEE